MVKLKGESIVFIQILTQCMSIWKGKDCAYWKLFESNWLIWREGIFLIQKWKKKCKWLAITQILSLRKMGTDVVKL